MRELLIGIDSRTQFTKAIAINVNDGKVLGLGTVKYDLLPNLPPGAKGQNPDTWRKAMRVVIKPPLKMAKTSLTEVKAFGMRVYSTFNLIAIICRQRNLLNLTA